MRIGIEANVWMRRLNILEPFQVAMGGTPLTLQAALDEELSRFQYVLCSASAYLCFLLFTIACIK
jgi:hypothetical protein